MNNKNYTAKQIVDSIGLDNILNITSDEETVKIQIKNQNKVDFSSLEVIDSIIDSYTSGNLLIIIADETNILSQELSNHVNKQNTTPLKFKNSIIKSIKTLSPIQDISDIFTPIIPVLTASGLVIAIHNIIETKGLFFNGVSVIEAFPQHSEIANMISTFANIPFFFLPVFLAFSATRFFGGSSILGATLGILMIHPDLLGYSDYTLNNFTDNAVLARKEGIELLRYWHIFNSEFSINEFVIADGQVKMIGLQGAILPIIFLSWMLAKLENIFNKLIPEAISSFLTPLLALFITGFIAFISISPIFREFSQLLAESFSSLYSYSNLLAGTLFGFLSIPITVTGFAQGFTIIESQLITDIARTGGSFVLPIIAVSNMAQGGATLGALFTTKNQQLTGIASVSSISAVFGVAEPAIFGVNLKLRYPFYAAMLATTISSIFITYYGVKSFGLDIVAGIPSLAVIASKHSHNYIIGMGIAFIFSFIITILFAHTRFNIELKKYEESPDQDVNDHNLDTVYTQNNLVLFESLDDDLKSILIDSHSNNSNPDSNNQEVFQDLYVEETSKSIKTFTAIEKQFTDEWIMPIDGEICTLEDIPKCAFSDQSMGAGFVIRTNGDTVISPIKGKVSAIFSSQHAICIETENNEEILLHVGLDPMIKINGFKALVTEGEVIEISTPLLKIDWKTTQEVVDNLLLVIFTSFDNQSVKLIDNKPSFFEVHK